MSISGNNTEASVRNVRFEGEMLKVEADDGRVATVSLEQFPRLLGASDDERRNWEFCAGGSGIHWPDLDEDLSLDALLS